MTLMLGRPRDNFENLSTARQTWLIWFATVSAVFVFPFMLVFVSISNCLECDVF